MSLASPEERPMDVPKTWDDNCRFLNVEALAKKDDEEKWSADAGSFFDCRICLDVAKEPVVTCCGHLFCWPCLYRWLNIHSVAKECPVCKGGVAMNNLTPINGRGMIAQKPEIDSAHLKIPVRPQARRVESWGQAIRRDAFAVPMEGIVRRLGRKSDFYQVDPHRAGALQESPERSDSLLNLVLTSRGLRREQNNVISPNNAVDLAQGSPTNTEMGEGHVNSAFLFRSNSDSVATTSHLTSALSFPERLFVTDFPSDPVDTNLELPLTVNERDDFSTYLDIQSESRTGDSSVEMDFAVSLSTSSSRRRNDDPRSSYADIVDLRASRRRRLV